MSLDLRDQAGKVRRVDVMAKEKQTPLILDRDDIDQWRLRNEEHDQRLQSRPRYKELGNKVMIIKLSDFLLSDYAADGLIDKARAHSTLIVDLRGNPGGSTTTLRRILGGLFANDVKIGDEVRRTKSNELIATGRRGGAFTGTVIALVDSQSASAAEVFARVIQLEKRGTVIGDLTSGRVMSSAYHSHTWGEDALGGTAVLRYGVMVSEADFIMSDKKSLEHTGVIPDLRILPTNEDLLNGRDPVLSRAAEMAGGSLSPEKAGQIFPYEWPKE